MEYYFFHFQSVSPQPSFFPFTYKFSRRVFKHVGQFGFYRKPLKTSLSKMMKEGSELSNIEISDENIKSFEKIARKYSMQFSLMKDKSHDPPRYLVFFKARDVSVMQAAFREYTGVTLNRKARPSIRKKLQNVIAQQR